MISAAQRRADFGGRPTGHWVACVLTYLPLARPMSKRSGRRRSTSFT